MPKETITNFGGVKGVLSNESIILFGDYTYKNKVYSSFYGIGKVYRVVKGDKQDLIYINFGIQRRNKPRLVIANDNHSRRQTLTLKRGQICQVYGICSARKFEYQVENGVKELTRVYLLAMGIQGWYVPTMFDIRKMPSNEDLVEPNDKEKKFAQDLDNVLNEMMTGFED